MRPREAHIESIEARAFAIPTETPEADGTLEWDETLLVLVEARAAGMVGTGYSYTDKCTVRLIRDRFAPLLVGTSPLETRRAWHSMRRVARNLGTRGLVANAISALDVAIWDLKAKLLELPLSSLLGRVRSDVALYGSGGFTSYDQALLESKLFEWTEEGITRVKMKVGSDPERDPERVRSVRATLGGGIELFVDANGAYHKKQALYVAERLAEYGVTWFEEPVSSDDRDGLQFLVERAPSTIRVATGEYGYDPTYFRDLIASRAADVLQVDVTRCLGITGFLQVAALCDVHKIPLSTHTAPALHLHLGVSLPGILHLEYFRDHVRIESLLFDGIPPVENGTLAPQEGSSGLGISLKEQDARKFAVTA